MWKKASQLLHFYKISSDLEYQILRREYSGLPENPSSYYLEWPGNWSTFIETPYYPWAEFKRQIKKRKITNEVKYLEAIKTDKKFPYNPIGEYPQWNGFQAIFEKADYYSFEEFRKVIKSIGVTSRQHYALVYKRDERLHSAPHFYYKSEWFNWTHAKGEKLNSLDTAEFMNLHNIKTEKEYQSLTESEMSLVDDPVTEFRLENFEELLTLKTYNAEKILQYCKHNLIYSMSDYDNYHADNPALAHLPRATRAEGYVTWRDVIPVKPIFHGCPQEYHLWFDVFKEFVTKGSNLGKKTTVLRYFINDYLAKYKQPQKPAEFFQVNHTPPSLNEWLKMAPSSKDENRRQVVCKAAMTHVFNKICCFVDEDTGETIRLEGFKNHFEIRNNKLSKRSEGQRTESAKPALPLVYLKAAEKYLTPESTCFLKDLSKAQMLFPHDWYDVNPNIINKNDDDCVYRKKANGQYQMWSPVRAIAMLCLVATPFRGQQILWLDSGEADDEIPIFENGKFIWVNNINLLKEDIHRNKKPQGFLSHLSDKDSTLDGSGSIGAYINSNKTGQPFDIAWLPTNVIRWVIRLRDWQIKYNPIKRLTAWSEIKLSTNTDNEELIARGHQAFLFRDPTAKKSGETAFPYLPAFMGTYLPKLLFNIQTEDYPLAELKPGCDPTFATSFTSPYTPHAMRVSIITSLVMDYDLPIAVVSKLVGHAQILMTLYYTKVSNTDIRRELTEKEEKALAKSFQKLQDLINDHEYDTVKKILVAQNKDLIKTVMVPSYPSSALIFKDIGICPYSNSRCHQGGLIDKNNKAGSPVPAGYLGSSNCLQCRFLITGAPFAGAMSQLANEIALEIKDKSYKKTELEEQLRTLERAQYDCERKGIPFDGIKDLLRVTANLESFEHKLVVLLADQTSALRYALMSRAILIQSETNDTTQLLATGCEVEISAMIEEVGEFRQLAEICRRSTIYISSEPDRAIPKLSMMIDKMMKQNRFEPFMFELNPEEQLKVGNQLTRLLKDRFNCDWSLIEELASGQIKLSEFGITPKDVCLKSLIKYEKTDNSSPLVEILNDE